MSDIGKHYTMIVACEIVIFYVACHIDIGSCGYGIAHQFGSAAAA